MGPKRCSSDELQFTNRLHLSSRLATVHCWIVDGAHTEECQVHESFSIIFKRENEAAATAFKSIGQVSKDATSLSTRGMQCC
mmetsp:Transcript_87420/g.173514  ORF Transcript_87420/g.173514 Transcript_87420/m.173514 type:complete len:82 (+) Transcript_87420:83-328(+)